MLLAYFFSVFARILYQIFGYILLFSIYFMIKIINQDVSINTFVLVIKIKIMRFRSSTNQKSMTGQVPQPVTFSAMKKRVNAVKFRTSTKSFSMKQSQFDLQPERQVNMPRKTVQAESDSNVTNFWPVKPQINNAKNSKLSLNQVSFEKRSQDSSILRPYSQSMQVRSRFRLSKTGKKENRGVDALTYLKEIKYFGKLYQLLGNVLASIRTGMEDMESAVSEYGKFIRDPYLNFIDDFTEGRSDKIKKTLRISRIHEYLSIAYMFLQIAQQRMENNESYLVNFLGYSLSNLIFTARIYILTERRPEFEDNQFEKAVEQFQTSSYGQVLSNLDDVLLRVQHNNQIITMIHKKLGQYNEKFQQCIRAFLKNAERRKYTTCLCAHYIFQYLAMHIHESELVGVSQFLQVSPTPYLAPPQHDYTLVFEPLGILKHNEQYRPYMMQFIKWASKYFDLVLWTWEMPSEIQEFVSYVEPYLFSKLYRYHCIIKDGVYTKDLNRLGRNLKKTLIIDFDQRIYSATPKNGFVSRWKGKIKDKGLLVICEVLEQMIGSESQVQQMLTFYSEEIHGVRGS